jgi:GntR family transcriptional regulator/MocR family aminotransferase
MAKYYGTTFELAIRLPAKGSRELLRSLHRQLRGAMADGRLQSGLRLPATRTLARHLGISRNTVIAAYDLLLSEGYLVGRGGSGTYVADARPAFARPNATVRKSEVDRRIAAYWRNAFDAGDPALRRAWRYDFRTGVPDLARFPFDVWQRLSTRAARGLAKERAVREEAQGRHALREAIAHHVSFARAVACHADDIVVTSGTRQSLDLLARILVTPGETEIAVEDPVYTSVRRAFSAAGARIASLPVDSHGLVVERLSPSARVICVSPSHQFPLGVAMSARRRAALLDFAQTFGAVIIEDDYDSEFRLEGRPLDALQTLDRAQSVFYIGTFSKSLFPALRLGFVVVPPWARHALIAAKQVADGHCPVLPQDTLAAFIADGHLARHIRKMRKVYTERHVALVDALARHCSERLHPIPAVAGVHLAAQLTGPLESAAVTQRAAEAGIRVETLDRYAQRRSAQTGLVFGYGMIEAEDIYPAIRKLARLLG